MMQKLANFITKYAWPIFIVIILITIFAAIQAKNLKIEDDITKYISEDDPDIKFYGEVIDKFGGSQMNISMISLEYEDLFILENLERIKSITERLETAPFVKSVNSFLNMPKIITTDVGLEVKDLVEVFPENDEEAKELKLSLLNDKLVKGKFISEDGNVALLMVESVKDIEDEELKVELENIIEPIKGQTLQVHYFGMPFIMAEMSESSWNTMRLGIIAAVTVLLILFFCFRSVRGVLLPLAVALLSSIWVMGFVASTGRSATMMISAIPVLMISLATAYGIHFVSRYYEERHNINPIKAVNMTIRDIFVPILMSALTTMAGFLSLTAAIVRPMTEFGFFSTMGIFFAFVLATFLLGSFFTIFPPPKIHKKFLHESNDVVTRLLRRLSQLILKEKKIVLIAVLIIILISVAFSTRVKTESSIEARMGAGSEIVKIMNYFNEKFGGTDFLYVYTESNNVKNPYVLRQMKKIGDYSRQFGTFGEPSSITDFLTQLNDAMENKNIIPAREQKIDNLWFFAGDNEYISTMIGDNNEDTLLQISTKEMTSTSLDYAITEMYKFIEEIPKKVRSIGLSEIEEDGKLAYYQNLAEEIISSLMSKNIEIENPEILKEELIKIAETPDSEFEKDTKEFVKEILKVSSLEIEDLGIASTDLLPIFTNYIKEKGSQDNLLEELMENLTLSEDDAIYLLEGLEISKKIVQDREKVRFAQSETERLIGKNLTDEEKDILWYLMDEEIYVPDDNGEIEVSFTLTGIPVITDKINTSLFRGQAKSIIVAFIAVSIMLMLQFGSLVLGLFAMIPITLTIITAFGIMGLLNIDLNIGTIMVASIAIGAGIDYTIHYISRYKNELKRKTKIEAMKTTLTGTGRAIVFNSVSVAAGVFVLGFSEIQMMAIFGKLIGSVMLLSVIYTLTLLPILLNSIKLKEEGKK
ncbi:MAG: MMPL family transporter [Candidatus Caldatribacteriota bacterium]|nr:MMPL family transporter [Candidatus Caldatribacteriota bacterium]